MNTYRLDDKTEKLLAKYRTVLIESDFSTSTVDVEIQQVRKYIAILGIESTPDYEYVADLYKTKVKRFYDWYFRGEKPCKKRKAVKDIRQKRYAEIMAGLKEYDERHKKRRKNSMDGHIAYCDSHSVMFGRGEETGRFWR